MKILIAADTYYPDVNGASYFSHRLASALSSAGHEVVAISPANRLRSYKTTHESVKIEKIWAMPMFINNLHFCLPILVQPAVNKIFEGFKPDVVHIQGHFFLSRAVFNAARKRRIPVVGTNHFMPENLTHYLPVPQRVRLFTNKLSWAHFRRTFKHLSFITTPTKTAAKLLRRIGLNQEVLIVSCGLDLTKFQKREKDIGLMRRFSLPNKPTLLYLGRVDKEKNINLVIKALPAILKKTDIHFVVAGKGMELKRLMTMTKNLGVADHITFTSFIPDEILPQVYNLADCYIIASEVELQCITCMEAMASGLPVIGANAMALPELVHHNRNGFLFRPGDVGQIAECVIKVFSDKSLREKMGQESLTIIHEHNIDNTIRRFENIYQEAQKHIQEP